MGKGRASFLWSSLPPVTGPSSSPGLKLNQAEGVYKSPSWGSVERCPPWSDAVTAGGPAGGRMGTGCLGCWLRRDRVGLLPCPRSSSGWEDRHLDSGAPHPRHQAAQAAQAAPPPGCPQGCRTFWNSSGVPLPELGPGFREDDHRARLTLTGHDAFRHDGLCGRTDAVIVSGCPHTVPHGPLWVSCSAAGRPQLVGLKVEIR